MLPSELKLGVRQLSSAYLAMQGLGGLAWWVSLFAWPNSRQWFMAAEAPDSTLLAFALSDLSLFVGGSLLAAFGLRRRASWAWPLLCIHTGAAVYAGLYCHLLWWLDRQAWIGAVMMTPPLFVPALITWRFRPTETPTC